jgi:hypothetical protein
MTEVHLANEFGDDELNELARQVTVRTLIFAGASVTLGATSTASATSAWDGVATALASAATHAQRIALT